MNTLLERVHNFLLPLVRGEDHVCGCTCGRHQVYHVVPYYGADCTVDSREHCFLSTILTQQEMDLITGVLLGLCISWFLLWLEGLWHSGLQYWRSNNKTLCELILCLKGSPAGLYKLVKGAEHYSF